VAFEALVPDGGASSVRQGFSEGGLAKKGGVVEEVEIKTHEKEEKY